MAAILESNQMDQPVIQKFKPMDIVYVRNWPLNEHVEVLQRVDVMTPLPHYIVRTQHGAKYQISQLELSKHKIEQ